MNIIDMVIFLIMSISMVVGSYNGFILSALHTASFFLSWLIAVIFYPFVTKIILGVPVSDSNHGLICRGSVHIHNVEDRASIRPYLLNSSKRCGKIQLPAHSTILVSDFNKHWKASAPWESI